MYKIKITYIDGSSSTYVQDKPYAVWMSQYMLRPLAVLHGNDVAGYEINIPFHNVRVVIQTWFESPPLDRTAEYSDISSAPVEKHVDSSIEEGTVPDI